MGAFLTNGALIEEVVDVVTSSSALILTNKSPTVINLTGSVGQTIRLPDATSIVLGVHYLILNNSSAAALVKDFTNSVTYGLINPNGGGINFRLLSGITATGVWSKEFTSGDGFIMDTLTAGASGTILASLTFSAAIYCGSLIEYSLNAGNTTSVAEVTDITTHAGATFDVIGTGKYFKIHTPTIDYYVWFSTTDGINLQNEPSLTGQTGIQVTVSILDTDVQVAEKLALALSANGSFTTNTPTTATLTVTNKAVGSVADATKETSGAIILVTTQGVTVATDGQVRVGRLMVAMNANNQVSVTDDYNETGSMSVTWDGIYKPSDNTVELSYTNPSPNNLALQASIKKFPK